MPRLKAILMLSLATGLVVPTAFAQNTNTASPGAINYVEGQVTINGQSLTPKSVGSAQLAAGQTISTQNGKAEVLLTPGVFLRLGDNSAVTMVSPDLTKTEVQLDRGTAEVEVDQIYKQNNLLVDQGPAQTTLLKDGLYEFNAANDTMRVFDGEAAVSDSPNSAKWTKVKAHHEFALNGDSTKPQSFDASVAANHDPLYNWSKLRADYLGQANLNLAESYAGSAFAPGWWWDPGLYAYTWLPGEGLFWDPFGFGFYSPGYLYGGGYIYPGYDFGGGYYGGFHGPYRGPVRRGGEIGGLHGAPPAHGFRGGARPAAGSGFRGGFAGSGGFHGGGGFAGGGGFHGGGGGFHGGGGGRR